MFAGVLVLLLVVGASLPLFVWPSTDSVQPADAVVVLAGGNGERLERGLELVRDGIASTLVLSFGPDDLCGSRQTFEVVCFVPSPENTRGEAETVADLARDRGWSNVVVVTSTSHVTRARLLVERCYEGELQVADATPDTGVPGWVLAIAHEWGGLAGALVERGC
jgi:uncharacterized SAM-binding protein YcdF (DUF218 family)